MYTTPKKYAAKLNLPYALILQLLREGKVPSIRHGNKYHALEEDLDKYFQDVREESTRRYIKDDFIDTKGMTMEEMERMLDAI